MKATITKLTPEKFPTLLKEINDPPKELYIQGPYPSETNKFLTVVGSRRISPYGKVACEKLISGLRGYPVVIISGLAMGTDAAAHESAIENNLATIAVPGSGLDPRVLYPRTNVRLAEKILEKGGCLLSEYAPDFQATPWSFPRRNRIMAGLAHATFVIEAEKKSGTLITSKLATEYNRDVLALPGPITSSLSEGPNMLIRLGATPITSSENILEVLGFKVEEKKEKDFSDCTEEEKMILDALASPISRDSLIRLLGWPAHKTNITLASLELNGYIAEEMGEIRKV